LALYQAVRIVNRRRHQLGRLVAGVAEHQALVSGPDVLALRLVLVDAHRDVAALLAHGHEHRAGVGGDSHLVVGVADVADHVAHHLLVVDRAPRGDLAGDDGQPRGDHRFARHAAAGILSEEGVEHTVGDLVGQLVRMPHAHRLAGEEVPALCHGGCLASGIEVGRRSVVPRCGPDY